MAISETVLSIILPVFSIIGLGYIFAHFKKINLDSIVEILLYITIPALVIASLSRKPIVISEFTLIAISAISIMSVTALASFIYLSVTNKRGHRGFYLTTIFMNAGNLPFPLALLAFGDDGLALTVMFYVVMSILVYSLGIYIAKGSGGLAETLKLPLIYSVVFAVILNLSGYKLPAPILTTCEMLGVATIPLMLVSLGYQLYSTKLSHIKESLAASFIRIGVGLGAGIIAVTVLNIDGLLRQIILLSAVMPSAVITFIFSYRYNVQHELVASTVAISTLISILTIPLLFIWIL